MGTHKLSLAEWIYLKNPLASKAYELIGYTILELLFLGALKVETRAARHFGPRDSKAGGVMQYFYLGDNYDKFHYLPHQEAILRKIKDQEGTSIPTLFERLILHFGENGKTFTRAFIIPGLKAKNILQNSYRILHSIELSLPARTKEKSDFKNQMAHVQPMHIPIEPDYLCEYGPLVLWASGNLSRELRGQVVEKSSFSSSIYAYNLKKGVSLHELTFRFPPFPVENFLKIAEKRFNPEEHSSIGSGPGLLDLIFSFLRGL